MTGVDLRLALPNYLRVFACGYLCAVHRPDILGPFIIRRLRSSFASLLQCAVELAWRVRSEPKQFSNGISVDTWTFHNIQITEDSRRLGTAAKLLH